MNPDLQPQTDSAIPVDESNLDLSAKGIWQPLPNETPGSYAAFAKYLDLGLDASLQQVADATGKPM